jgi:taurine dioxygenase
MSLTLQPLSEVMGTEIIGLDLRQPIAHEDAQTLRQALLDHHVVLVNQVGLSDREHMRYCEVYGDIQAERTVVDAESDEVFGMMHVSNVLEGGVLPNGDMWLHSDQCYFDTPGKCTSLYGIETPKSGGHTRFSDCIAAYEDLPEATKKRIEGLKAINYYDYFTPNSCKKVTDWKPDAQHHAHPVVRFHPETGTKSIYVNRLMTENLVDVDEDAGREILEELFDMIEDERFIYTHPWKPGDLMIWDNRCLVHGRTDFDPAEPRILRRFAVRGEVPC